LKSKLPHDLKGSKKTTSTKNIQNFIARQNLTKTCALEGDKTVNKN